MSLIYLVRCEAHFLTPILPICTNVTIENGLGINQFEHKYTTMVPIYVLLQFSFSIYGPSKYIWFVLYEIPVLFAFIQMISELK